MGLAAARALILRFLWALVGLAPGLAAANPAQAQVDLAEEADLQFVRGVAAYRRGDFEAALSHLLLSNRLVPNRNVAFNIARCYEQLSQFDAAFRHYHAVFETEPDLAQKAQAHAALQRIAPKVALLQVDSSPPGARIFIDRRDLGARGLTPLVLALPAGSHTVLLDRDGYAPAEGGVTVVTGERVTVTLPLAPILGQLRIEGGPAGAEVRVEGQARALGTLPLVMSLAPGTRILEITAPGHRPARIPVTVQAQATSLATVELELVTGTLVIDADEAQALIEIDGEARGFTPAVLRDVPVGRHSLRVKRAGFRPFEATVEVEADAELRITADLRTSDEVVGASRTAQSVAEAPASVSLISAQEIRAFGYETLHDALLGSRGVFSSDDRTYPSLGLRGFTRSGDYGNRLLVTLDGHTMNDDQLGSSYVGRDFATDLGDVRRLELVRGTGSALYGTNAFFGVVNVVTADAESLEPAHVQVAHGGPRLGRARVGVGQRLGEDGGVWFSAAAARSQGEDLRLGFAPSQRDGSVMDADGLESGTLAGKAWWGDLTLQASFNRREKQIPTGAYGTVPGDARTRATDTRAFVEGRFEPRLGEARLTARAYLDHYAYAGDFAYSDPTVGLLRDRWSGLWSGGELRLAGALGDALRYTVGAEARAHLTATLRSEDAGGRFLDEQPGFQTYAGYGLLDYRLARAVSLNASARVDHFSNVGTTFSPRLAALIRPTDRDLIKLIAGRAFRAPSPYELRYNDGGTTQVAASGLDPESVLTGEIEYSRQLSDTLQLIVAGFYNQVSDLVDLTPLTLDGGSALQYQNSQRGLHTLGGEAELRRDWRQGWFFAGTYAFAHSRLGALDGSERLINAPAHLFALKLAAPLARTGATLANRLRIETPRPTRDGEETELALLWDVTVTGEVGVAGLDYAFGVRNLLDWRHHQAAGEELSFLRIPQPGRSVYARLTARY